jgi:class 3 adenylate cyclase/CHASE2 domain-containing sensor protein
LFHFAPVNLKSFKLVPVLIAACAIGLALLFRTPFFKRHFDLFQRLEWVTYDQRVKAAQKFPRPNATNLAAVFLDEATVKILNQSWPYPRQLHARVVRELAAEGANAVAFDIIFGELHPLDSPVLLPDQTIVESDDFFAQQMRLAGNVILAVEPESVGKSASVEEANARSLQFVYPPPLFATNAMAIGAIVATPDSDGVLRRAKAFIDDPEHGRIWHMGIVLAAKQLGLDLDHAIVQPGKLTLNGPNGIQRIIPIDSDDYFYIDWTMPWDDARLTRLSYGTVVSLDEARKIGPAEYRETLNAYRTESGATNLIGDAPFRGKLVVIGSRLIGNNVTDRGATPIHKSDFLVSKHWNVANSILTNTFIRRSPNWLDVLLIAFTGVLSAFLTLRLRALAASVSVAGFILVYIVAAFFGYIQFRYWIPIVLPVLFAMAMTHVCLVTYRVLVEQKERRRVKDVFSKMVSPHVVNELLNVEKLSLGGARREITVYFADVRGFTEMTDLHQARAEEFVRQHNLTGEAAEAHFDSEARKTLETVNLYLGTIADKIKEHNGTLDKYIGDCVMAFWGAPTANPQHALNCVRAAIDSQRAMHVLNQQRAAENERREKENVSRIAAGEPPLDMLPLLSLGSGINTGIIIAGLMGSDVHGLNYTVFGREVNLASRLEGVSGRGRIIIGESTYRELLRDDPQLAATCVELPPEKVKGFRHAVKIYEVPWKTDSTPVSEKKSEPPVAANS